MEFEPDTRMRLASDRVTWKLAGDEVIALQLSSYEYLAAPDSAAEIWQRLTAPVTPTELAAWLADRYGIDANRALSGPREPEG